MFLIIVIAEAARIIMTVPAKEAIRDVFANLSFEGSPMADKNNIPVAIQKIITVPRAIGHATLLTTLFIIPATVACAPAITGKTSMPNKIKYNIFLFTPLEIRLYKK